MQIIINGRLAALKQGASCEYVSENRLFSGADAYTLNLDFPLIGCEDNVQIFGSIFRQDVPPREVVFDCELRDGTFVRHGALAITSVTPAEVKAQFLEGRSAQNFYTTLENTYINELALGQWPTFSTLPTPFAAATSFDGMVAIPWVNEASDTASIQNEQQNAYPAGIYWAKEGSGERLVLSWMLRLHELTRRICEAIEYECDLTEWENDSILNKLLVCNCLPAAWEIYDFARALPHWSVKEYFEKLEAFLGAEFDFDHKAKHISFRFTKDVVAALPIVRLDNVLDEFTCDISTDEDVKCDFVSMKNIVYSSPSYALWKYMSCRWFIDKHKAEAIWCHNVEEILVKYAHLKSFESGMRGQKISGIGQLFYAADIDDYFLAIIYSKENVAGAGERPRYQCKTRLLQLNSCGGYIMDESEDADALELDFVPANIAETDDEHGPTLTLSLSSFDGEGDAEADGVMHPLFGVPLLNDLLAGEEKTAKDFYDKIHVAFFDGGIRSGFKFFHPIVDRVTANNDWGDCSVTPYSFRLDAANSRLGYADANLPLLDPRQKVTVKWLSTEIPNPRSLFLIRGKRYLCEKITATFTAEAGMSQLLSGVFYPLL